MAKISKTARALWSVLISSLVAPAIAALLAVGLSLAATLSGFTVLTGADATLGEVGMRAFAWSALPATIAALALTPYVLSAGGYGWLNAAVAGVLAFGVSAIIFPFAAGPAMPLLAFLAGLIAIGVRRLLFGINILSDVG